MAINNEGWVVGYGQNDGARGVQAFLLTPNDPVPLPGAALLFIPGLAGIVALKHQKGKHSRVDAA